MGADGGTATLPILQVVDALKLIGGERFGAAGEVLLKLLMAFGWGMAARRRAGLRPEEGNRCEKQDGTKIHVSL
jgi:hypothetical protein